MSLVDLTNSPIDITPNESFLDVLVAKKKAHHYQELMTVSYWILMM